MTAIPLSSGVSELLQKAEKLPATDFEALFSNLLKISANRRARSLSGEEAGLLKKVNRPFPEAKMARFRFLEEKRAERTLSADEHGELLRLVQQLERFDAKRLQLAGQLAALRGLPLRELVQSLGLFPHPNGQ